MNSDPTKASYWEVSIANRHWSCTHPNIHVKYMNMVGAMHAGHLRRNPLEIDVIHFSLLIGYVQNTLTEAILLSSSISTHNKAPLVKAWGKLLWIQMDLFTKWHVKDGKEYDQLTTRATKLDPATDLNSMKDDNGNEVKCPFSNVAKLEQVETNGILKRGYMYENSGVRTRNNIPGGGIGSIESIAEPLSLGCPVGTQIPGSPQISIASSRSK